MTIGSIVIVIANLTLNISTITLVFNKCTFPDPRECPGDRPLGWGGDLSVERLLAAYRQGIFPWYDVGEPILWWCPDPRFVLPPTSLKVSSSLKKELKKAHWRVTFDEAFPKVIRACAQTPRPGQAGTWITEEMQDAYIGLHELGYAHSVECWSRGELVGGLYGVSLGGMFFGESMFHHAPNASKVAFVRLVERLQQWEFALIDCQMPTKYLASFGAHLIPREQFLDILELAMGQPMRQGNWSA